MEKPDATTIAWYEEAVPSDGRAVRSQMFGFPCAFVSGHMFFGTFARAVVARVGEVRAAALVAAGKGSVFGAGADRRGGAHLHRRAAAKAAEGAEGTDGEEGRGLSPPVTGG